MKRPFLKRLTRKLRRMWLHPIRVFVFHQVSDVFEPDTMWDIDWTQTDKFKENIRVLMKGYTFISLNEVKEHLDKDRFRFRDYAALTSDDGWSSLKNVLPWLVENKVPVTLFLNPSCLDGVHRNSRETDKLLTEEEVRRIIREGAPYVSVASHGWTHQNCKTMSKEEFEENVRKSEAVLETFPGKVPFYAFASGLSRTEQVSFLKENHLIPVFVDGMKNESAPTIIHRECLDGHIL